MFQFTFGLPLYILLYSIVLTVALPIVNVVRFGCPEYMKLEEEGGEFEVK